MNFQNTKKDLKVVISVGDESGIGPEIILKALFLICIIQILFLNHFTEFTLEKNI